LFAGRASRDRPRVRLAVDVATAYAPAHLSHCVSIADLRALARRKLPQPIFDYLDGGAEDERTLARNIAGFDDLAIVPRVLCDVGRIDTTTKVLGAETKTPLICAPTGASRFYHADAEPAVARAAAKKGVLYSLSTMSTTALEDVAAAADGPKMFQLYVFKDRGVTRELIARAKAAGFTALCLTVDASIRGKRERELRSGMGVPLKLRPSGYLSFALKPGWLARQGRAGQISMPNFARFAASDNLVVQTRFVAAELDPSVTWDDLDQFAELWSGPFAVKGVTHGEDARCALDHGVGAIIVSNHGGRQLDGSIAAIDALPDVVKAVNNRAEIILDGGIRRGTHILKALALGATACSIGRPYLYGLAAGGEAGVTRTLDILSDELAAAMRLSGCADIAATRRLELTVREQATTRQAPKRPQANERNFS
jgi:L-lactate dehydrogenase (cytochrome)